MRERSFNLQKRSRPPKQKFDPNPNWAVSSKDARKSNRDIPFLFLPHTVKKAFFVNNSVINLPRCFPKYLWLSKSIPSNGLPDDYVISNFIPPNTNNKLSEVLAQSCGFQLRSGSNNRSEVRERIRHSLFENLLRIAMISGAGSDHLNSNNCFLYHMSRLETHWPRNYLFYNSDVDVDFVLKTRNGFPVVENTPDITLEELESLPGPYDNHGLGVFIRGLKPHLRNRIAMENSREAEIKYSHTALFVQDSLKTDESILAAGVINSFMSALSQAQDRGQLFGTELSNPVVTQCIVTNGEKIAFFVHQLNTMHFNDDKGVWNRVWMSPVMSMFKPQDDQKDYRYLYEDAAPNVPLEDLNEEFLNHFVQFIIKKTL